MIQSNSSAPQTTEPEWGWFSRKAADFSQHSFEEQLNEILRNLLTSDSDVFNITIDVTRRAELLSYTSDSVARAFPELYDISYNYFGPGGGWIEIKRTKVAVDRQRNYNVDVRNEIKLFVDSLLDSQGKSLPLDEKDSLVRTIFLNIETALARHEKFLPTPDNWEAARKQNPRLLTWDEAREDWVGARGVAVKEGHPASEAVSFTIIDHLRDVDKGYGMWTRNPPGLPLRSLLSLDGPAHRALYRWLSAIDPETGKKNVLPNDIHLPRKGDQVREEVSGLTKSELREADRLLAASRRYGRSSPGRGAS
jgi:hypothetical protein